MIAKFCCDLIQSKIGCKGRFPSIQIVNVLKDMGMCFRKVSASWMPLVIAALSFIVMIGVLVGGVNLNEMLFRFTGSYRTVI